MAGEDLRAFMIPAGHARLWPMQAGQRVTIVQTLGQQVGDLIALNGADLTEFLSPSHTRRCLAAWRIQKGQALFTNRRREIVELARTRSGSTTSWRRPATPIATCETGGSPIPLTSSRTRPCSPTVAS